MTTTAELLIDGYERIRETVREVLEARRLRPDRPPGSRRQHDRLARLASHPGPGRSHRRRRRYRAGLDGARMG